MGVVLLVGLVALSLGLYFIWGLVDARRAGRAAAIADDVAALGDDAVPASIHPTIDPDRCMGSGSCVRACPEHDVIAIVGGQAQLVNPLACIGHGACAAACPVDAISLVFGTAKRGVELPQLSPAFETSQPGIYVAGELGGMGLIRNAVEQGRQVAGEIARGARRGDPTTLDVLVIGAGPAGIAASLGLAEAGLRAHLVDQNEFGGTIRHYPRAKVVMTGALELPGYGKVKRRTMTKEELGALWDDVRAQSRLSIETGITVEGIEKDGDAYVVRAGEWHRRAANVVLALGRRGSPRTLGVPGEDLAKVHYRLLEPEPFNGHHVLVVGGGNAAAECALALSDFGGCASVAMSYRRAGFARLRRQVMDRVDEAMMHGRITVHFETEVASISARQVTLKGRQGPTTLSNDAVIVQVGGTPPSALLASAGVATVEKRGEA